MRLEVVIPFYNEAHRLSTTIPALAEELQRKKTRAGIRVSWADDGSTDGSSRALHELLARHFPPDPHAPHGLSNHLIVLPSA